MITLLCINWTATLSVISSLAAIAGVCVAILSWKQMIDARKARLIFSVKSIDGIFFLEVRNVGQSPAFGVIFKMNDEFSNCIIVNLKNAYTSVEANPFKLNGGDFKLFYILPADEKASLDENGTQLTEEQMKCRRCAFFQNEIEIKGKYIEMYEKKTVAIDEKFMATDYITTSAAIPNCLYEIKKHVKSIDKKLK